MCIYTITSFKCCNQTYANPSQQASVTYEYYWDLLFRFYNIIYTHGLYSIMSSNEIADPAKKQEKKQGFSLS